MEKYVLSVCLAADLNYELKTMLHQHQARLDICDSLERAEEGLENSVSVWLYVIPQHSQHARHYRP